jgi:hypothetical protein
MVEWRGGRGDDGTLQFPPQVDMELTLFDTLARNIVLAFSCDKIIMFSIYDFVLK